MLIVDPLSEWADAQAAVSGVRDLGYASPNLLGYYPRVIETGADDGVARPVGGAIAGLLCKQDRTYGPWHSLEEQGLALQRRLRPVVELSDDDQHLLLRAGLNAVRRGQMNNVRVKGAVTMGRGSEAYATYAKLPVRRFCLQLINSIARATRWAVFEPEDDTLAERLDVQVLTYLQCLHDLGAFADEKFLVQCDAGVSNRPDSKEHGVTILLVFQPVNCDEPISLTLHQTAAGFRVGSTAFGLTIRSPNT